MRDPIFDTILLPTLELGPRFYRDHWSNADFGDWDSYGSANPPQDPDFDERLGFSGTPYRYQVMIP
jgi:hypothetical protein